MANLFPTEKVTPETVNYENSGGAGEIPFGRSWQFDFGGGEFVMTPTGKIARCEGADAWLEWCRKAIATARYELPIYSRNYGQEFVGLLGSGMSQAAYESEIERIARETLMVDPRTAEVGGFSFSWEEGRCFFTCQISNVRGETGTITESVVIM